MIAFTRPEFPRILRVLVLPQSGADPEHILRWSRWPRRHQLQAPACHRRWNEVTAAA